jgi:hypothetical protein
MKRKLTTFSAVVLAVILGACQQSETRVNGILGSSSVSGKVTTTGDLTGSSPAGIEVSVRGTGMRTVLDQSGAFSMFGLPAEDATLHFTRADGVDATYVLAKGESQVDISLTKSSAKSRRRGVGHPGAEIEGLISATGEGTITVKTGNGSEYVVTLTETTIIRKGNRTLTVEDLTVDTRVHVKALRGDGDSLNAVEIKVQNANGEDDGDDDSTPAVTANGIVTEVGTDYLMVHTADGRDIKVMVDENTRIKREGKPFPLAEIEVNDRAECMGTRVDDTTILAKKIETQDRTS